jgi:hypothetical protein
MIQAAPLVLSFARAVPMLNRLVGAVGITELGNRVNNYIQENPEESEKIVSMIMPAQGIANALKNKSSEEVEEVEETEEVTTGSGVEERIREILREAGVEDADNQDLTDLPKDLEAKVMSGIAKSSTDRKKDMIEASAIIGLSGPGRERKKMIDDISERYDEGGIEEVTRPKYEGYKKYLKKRYADGGSIGIEVLFEEKKPRKNFNTGGTTYDPRASAVDYATALNKVGAGTDAQKLQAIGEYGLNQMQNSPSYFKAVGQGINQHMLNNQMLRDAVDARRITEDQYKLMGGYDVAKLTPKIGLGNIKIGGTPGDVGIASALYNAIKAGGIGLEKLGIKETDPYNQYGDIGFFESIAKNYQGAKGLSESDKTLYESIISGKTQSDIDRFRSGLYAANQVDKATGDRLYGGNIEKMFNEYKKSPSTFFYAGDDTQNMYDRFNKYYADGGRVGLFMGGDPLTGQALAIYNSMNSYGFSDQEIANALQGQGLYTPGGSTPPETTQPNIIGSQINQGGDTGPTRPTSEIVSDFSETITNRQNKLNNPGKIASFVDKFVPKQKSIAEMLASGQVDTRKTSGIPLGVGSIIAKALPDKYYDMSLADQITTQAYMGFTDPNTNMANKDPFGLNVRSAFGNYAEKAADIVDTLEAKLEKNGFLSDYDKTRLGHYRNVTATKQDALADIGLINLAKEQERKRQEKIAADIAAGKSLSQVGKENYTGPGMAFEAGNTDQGGGFTGGKTVDSPSTPGGKYSSPRKDGGLMFAKGGLATMFKEKR